MLKLALYRTEHECGLGDPGIVNASIGTVPKSESSRRQGDLLGLSYSQGYVGGIGRLERANFRA